MSCILKFTRNKLSWALVFLHILYIEISLKFIIVVFIDGQL